ncbi:MAG: class I SAM-dependent methyltransferase [Deltaproteobacteria bacterium]|nr:class I SAM-dependent methyltransferase [Deltaproteobacteria bacterium]MBW2114149.1 class I SAM-dependent methyltransferase [Deltaproteobacteria bacterium]
MDLIHKFVASGHLLEIGPAVGYFAYQAKQAGFEVDTVEQDARCCEYLTTVVGVNAIRSDSPHTIIDTMDSHDVITMWHVIEHLPDPWACLNSATKNLVPGGVLLIATPNPAAFQFRVLGSFWPHVDAPRHLCLFPKDLLVQRLERLDMELVMIVSKDRGITYLNRFGWQRFLTNLFPPMLQSVIGLFFGYMGGYLISLTMKIRESREMCGSAYTIIFRKKVPGTFN